MEVGGGADAARERAFHQPVPGAGGVLAGERERADRTRERLLVERGGDRAGRVGAVRPGREQRLGVREGEVGPQLPDGGRPALGARRAISRRSRAARGACERRGDRKLAAFGGVLRPDPEAARDGERGARRGRPGERHEELRRMPVAHGLERPSLPGGKRRVERDRERPGRGRRDHDGVCDELVFLRPHAHDRRPSTRSPRPASRAARVRRGARQGRTPDGRCPPAIPWLANVPKPAAPSARTVAGWSSSSYAVETAMRGGDHLRRGKPRSAPATDSRPEGPCVDSTQARPDRGPRPQRSGASRAFVSTRHKLARAHSSAAASSCSVTGGPPRGSRSP